PPHLAASAQHQLPVQPPPRSPQHTQATNSYWPSLTTPPIPMKCVAFWVHKLFACYQSLAKGKFSKQPSQSPSECSGRKVHSWVHSQLCRHGSGAEQPNEGCCPL